LWRREERSSAKASTLAAKAEMADSIGEGCGGVMGGGVFCGHGGSVFVMRREGNESTGDRVLVIGFY